MSILQIDIETYSDIDLIKCGAYRYADSRNFEIFLFGYAFDDDPVTVVDLTAWEDLPEDVVEALTDPAVIKTAFNANFERTCIAKHFGIQCDPRQWRCTAVWSRALGLPGNLEKVAETLGLEAQKDTRGKNLIKYFSVPCKPTKANGGRTRNYPHHDPDKWTQYVEYNVQDVVVEREIRRALSKYPLPDDEWALWALDQQINDRGVLLDCTVADQAVKCNDEFVSAALAEAQEITGLENPRSLTQLKAWLADRGVEAPDGITKDSLPMLIEAAPDEDVKKVLEIRRDTGKTSVDKYEAMLRSVCTDWRIHGVFQFYGAGTGRWCLTGDHEILTPIGWVRLDQWQGGQIACYTQSGECISFQKANPLHFNYAGSMYQIESQRVSQISTPNHKMLYRNRYGTWETDTVQALAGKRFSIPFTGRRHTESGMEHDQLRILIMTQADGHYCENGDLRFRFKKQRKIERCVSLLRKAGILYQLNKYDDATAISVISRNAPLWLRQFRQKDFGYWLLDESADVIFDELEHWDAYRCGPNSIQYSTTNKHNADVIQALAHLSGRSAVITTKKRKESNWSAAYVVNIWLSPGNAHEIRKKPDIIPFKGNVYCAETPTGYFLVRRNGKVWVTGNSGRIFQPQNLPQNKVPDLANAREILRSGDFDMLEMLYGAPPFILSQLIRTALVPAPSCRFIVADFSAIEARVIAWLADEDWVLDVFRGHGKIYEATAAQMFKVPIETIIKGHPNYALRSRGKVATLACGYQGGPSALIAMGALKYGIEEDELQGLIDQWREANPHIKRLWYDTETCAKRALRNKSTEDLAHGVSYHYAPGILFARLPSGRCLAYQKPRIEPHAKFDKDSLVFNTPKKGVMAKEHTYGGKLVENLVQAIARDCLAVSMMRLTAEGYNIVMHVHDEVIIEAPEGTGSVENVTAIMGQPIPWAPGLPLKAAGYECDFYMKD